MGKYWVLNGYNPRSISNFLYPIGNVRGVFITGCGLVVNLEVLG